MQSTLLVREFPTRSILILPKISASHQIHSNNVSALILERFPASVSNASCSGAQYFPVSVLNIDSYSPLLRAPIYGVLGLIRVMKGL